MGTSRIVSFCVSNVDASWAGEHFVPCRPASPAARVVPRRLRAHAYGAAPGDCSLFIMVNSHGSDVHVGINAGCQTTDAPSLANAVHQALCHVIAASQTTSA